MDSNEQIFGHWETPPATWQSYNQMTLDATHLSTHWRRCSLTSDFWAHYIALSIPPDVPSGFLRREDMTGMLSYLLNELFENTAKFSGGPITTITYQAWLLRERIIFQIRNHIEPAAHPPFVRIIQEILEGDPDELYFQKLEANAEMDEDGSGLGYLTLIKDYGVRFGFRFCPVQTESIAVDVQAHLSIKEERL